MYDLTVNTSEFKWVMRPLPTAQWYIQDALKSPEAIYGGACGRMIFRAGTFTVTDGTVQDRNLGLDICCVAQNTAYDSIQPFSPFNQGMPCWECLLLYTEHLCNDSQERLKTNRALKRRVKKQKPDKLNSFERDQIMQLKRLAGKSVPDKLLP